MVLPSSLEEAQVEVGSVFGVLAYAFQTPHLESTIDLY